MRQCKMQECTKLVAAKDLCATHYRRFRLYGDPSIVKQVHKKQAKICEVAGCGAKPTAHSLCPKHYKKKLLYDDPTVSKVVQFHGLTLEERFWKYTVKKEGCWKWVGHCDPNGYGRLNRSVGQKRYVPVLAHRLSWEIHNGSVVPKGKLVCHKCDNPNCVNPDHLYVGDQLSNIKDMWNRGRANPGRSIGENHGMSKLSEDQVQEIRGSKETCRVLSNRYGISATQVSSIKNRKSWKHLT